MRWEFWKAVLILPGFALIYMPAAILWLTRNSAWAADPGRGKPVAIALGLVLLVAGLVLMVWTMRLFHAAGDQGTIAPWRPVGTFIVRGPYRYTRNPMLTGVNLVLAAEALLLRSAPLLLWLVFFVALNTVYFIRREEPALQARYGEAYRAYRRAVPRWLPRMTAYRQAPGA